MSKEYVYMDAGLHKPTKVRVGIAKNGEGNYSSPTILKEKRNFSVRTKEGRKSLIEYTIKLIEKNEVPFLTPQGRLNLEQAKEYLRIEST